MSIGAVSGNSATRKGARRHHLLSIFIALVFALMLHPAKVQAQINGNIEVSIPFQFHAGNAKLPPGNYIIHMLDNSDLTIMEIASVDGSVSALFNVGFAEANPTPAKTELIFNKYGNRYFLTKLFDAGDPNGSELAKSSYEKKASEAALEAQTHISAHRQGQQGN
jgi:hypothetical protein